MNAEAIVLPNINERATFRSPFLGKFEYICASMSGTASWSSASHQGASITIGRYLSPGRLIQICQDKLDVIGYVVWCKPTQETGTFLAGIRFIDKGIDDTIDILATVKQKMLLSRQNKSLKQHAISHQ